MSKEYEFTKTIKHLSYIRIKKEMHNVVPILRGIIGGMEQTSIYDKYKKYFQRNKDIGNMKQK